MDESRLRDLLARDISVLERGLKLLEKEQYLPATIGTRSFIDLYAKDEEGHHVLIELKRSDTAAREAIHEVHKYVEAVKGHFGARENEIRVLIASTEWKELLVPFSRLMADTSLALRGLHLTVKRSRVSVTDVKPLPMQQGRLISPWHEIHWFSTRRSLEKGLDSIKERHHRLGVKDYLVLVLRPPKPVPSPHQTAVIQMLSQLAKTKNANRPPVPTYRHAVYVAIQAKSAEEYTAILKKHDPKSAKETAKIVADMETEESLNYLHELFSALSPHVESEHVEIGYPAKFGKFTEHEGFAIARVVKEGTFARNPLLDIEAIASELRGETGVTGQRFSRTISIGNRAHVESARSELSACLDENPVWQIHVANALRQIEAEYSDAEVDISVYNPGTGMFTPYLFLSQEQGFLFVPSYHLIVRNPEPIRMYFGALEASGTPLSYRGLLRKYYEGDLGILLMNMTWGGRDSRDAEIVRDMGAEYRSFRADVEGEKRAFHRWKDDRWQSCGPLNLLSLYMEYCKKNDGLIRTIVRKVHACQRGGFFESVNTDRVLGDLADERRGKKDRVYYSNAPQACNICDVPLEEENYMIDARVPGAGAWANLCPDCFVETGAEIGWGKGQLYKRARKGWLLVAGFGPSDADT